MSPHQPPSASLLEQILIGALALVPVAMLSLPAARDAGTTFGWVPFWLVALPACAWATARALRRRHQAGARPSATVHRLRAGARGRDAARAQALRRAA